MRGTPGESRLPNPMSYRSCGAIPGQTGCCVFHPLTAGPSPALGRGEPKFDGLLGREPSRHYIPQSSIGHSAEPKNLEQGGRSDFWTSEGPLAPLVCERHSPPVMKCFVAFGH